MQLMLLIMLALNTTLTLVHDSGIEHIQGVPKKMFLSEMLQGRIFLNTPSFSMDKMRRI